MYRRYTTTEVAMGFETFMKNFFYVNLFSVSQVIYGEVFTKFK